MHQHLLRNGGYVEAVSAQKTLEPSVPQGVEFTSSDLIGTWGGSAFLGLTPNPTDLVFDLFRNGEKCKAKISLDFEDVFIADQSHEIAEIDLAQSHLRFSHPLKMTYEDAEALLKYDLVFMGDSLRGVARMFFEGKERGISEVELHRRD